MRRVILTLMILSIPLTAFLSVYRVYMYQNLQREVETLREEQSDLFERNKRMIANIAIVSSPERIEEIAREKLRLTRISPQQKLRIRIENEKDDEEGADG